MDRAAQRAWRSPPPTQLQVRTQALRPKKMEKRAHLTAMAAAASKVRIQEVLFPPESRICSPDPYAAGVLPTVD